MSWRNVIAFLLIACGASTSFCQEISGIGDFKVGMSIEEFLDLPLLKEKRIQDKANRKYTTKEGDAWKTTAESQVEKYYRVYSTDVVKFELKASMGVPKTFGGDSYDTTILFYKNKLASVYVSDAGPEFEKILTAKYGPPVKEDKTKRVICQNGYGAQSTHFDGTKSTIWGKGKKITAILSWSFYDCGNGSSSYTVADEAITKALHQIEQNGIRASEAEEAKTKAGASKL